MTTTMTYEMLSAFVRGLTGWDDEDLERAICLVTDAGADAELLGCDVRSMISDGTERIDELDPIRAAYLRILESAGLRKQLETYLVQGERGWEFQVDSDEACRIMASVPINRRGGAWEWLWEHTRASWSSLADEVEGQAS